MLKKNNRDQFKICRQAKGLRHYISFDFKSFVRQGIVIQVINNEL